ncbi:uncharacterized protein LOC127413330 [Myxocyprinus asiaticus]|uniref:uncharacterized protein LOC127413330 n=1 Tax=Myxocyprinus asiaticus TaxID=70543 RepID=UPI00222289E9|nr:uncharacterized protein LOC127413330 [Myxocyprinus asiaticus]
MSSFRRSTHFWSEEETDFLLQTLKEMNIDRYKDGRKNRNSLIFRKVCAKHKQAGFVRSCDQVKHRWKTLKSIYYKAKKLNQTSSNAAFKHFDTMEDIFGHRPLVMSNQAEVDIDFKVGPPLSESKCFIFEDGKCDDDDDDNGVDDVEGGIQEIQSVKTENEPLILTQPSNESSASTESPTSTQPSISIESNTCTQPSTSRQPPVQGMLKRKRPCCTALHVQYQDFLERMQLSQNIWLERQLEQSYAREERLISRVLAEHTHSMETLVNQLFAGLRSLLPQPPPNIQSNPQPTYTPPDILNTYPHVNPDEHWPPACSIKSSIPPLPEDHLNNQITETVNQ